MQSEWREEILVDCLDALIDYRGKTPKKSDHGVLTLSAKSVKMGRIHYSKAYFISKETYDKFMVRGFPKKGDILLTSEAPLGCVARLDRDDVGLAQRLLTLRGNKDLLDNDYLMYYLMSNKGQHELSSRATGTTVQGIKRTEFAKIKITLPPLPEQKTIAHILGSLDDKIELNRKMNETLEAMAQAMFKSWFVDFDPVIDNALAAGNTIPEELTERTEQRKALGDKRKKLPPEIQKLFPSEFIFTDELGWVPKGWEIKTANNIASISIGKTPPRKEQHWFSDKKEGNVIWASIRDMGNNGVFLGDSSEYLTMDAVKKFNVKVVPAESILLSFKLTVGRVAIAQSELATNEAIAHFVAPKDGISKEYLYCYLKNFDFGSLGSTSSIATAVNSKIIKAMPILTPSEDVLSSFEARTNNCFNKIELTTCQINATSKLRDTLLPKLLSGELRIKDAEKLVEGAL